jgi:hypothetical protein
MSRLAGHVSVGVLSLAYRGGEVGAGELAECLVQETGQLADSPARAGTVSVCMTKTPSAPRPAPRLTVKWSRSPPPAPGTRWPCPALIAVAGSRLHSPAASEPHGGLLHLVTGRARDPAALRSGALGGGALGAGRATHRARQRVRVARRPHPVHG